MKLLSFVALLMALGAGVQAAEPLARPASTNTPAGTNMVLIMCQGGAQVTTNHVVFRKSVKAQDSQMYLECELLTAWYSSKGTNAPKATAAGSNVSSDASDIDVIIAETNVMIITPDFQVIGDRAVYTATNDLMVVTGQLVVALNTQGSLTGTNIVYNMRSRETFMDGPVTTILNASMTGSNAPPPAPKRK